VVQFGLRPGEAAVTLGVGEEREVERILEQLRVCQKTNSWIGMIAELASRRLDRPISRLQARSKENFS
jgi:hypothetical protein